ncbi:uncharacterized protein FOMMEDRAFT_26340 [Fomitiporia mediterranea MF3/22]|uniref:uncharacterized protein n=1 Tax=Fomitiporia mediterranea (strain MF3/22) TaxID=694068 RepID=UPI0004407F40|nr:uncharacterized protein FOMMEDRAFT_26340 [Fomitiporia mediterranea MF3/22]EJD05410.1 hypothetical protein FOMMEDRAFT_26340 [Fomitiporia mediterranea MF3/22]
MHEQAQYAPAAHVPFIKSPSLRIPHPIEVPPDMHPLPDDINVYFAYPFTLEPHVLTLESSRAATIAAHSARHEAYLKRREENKERRRREALRRIAPGFEPQSGPLVPTKISGLSSTNTSDTRRNEDDSVKDNGSAVSGVDYVHPRSVMDDLVDHLAALDAVAGAGNSSDTRPSY